MSTTGYENESNGQATYSGMPIIDWSTNFAVTSRTADEVILTNKNTPIDQPNTIRVKSTPIANIYKGTGIHPTLQTPIKTGQKVQLSERTTLRDTISGMNYDFPVTCSIGLIWPNSSSVTAAQVAALLQRTFATTIEAISSATGVSVDEVAIRVNELMRGQLCPTPLN